MKTERQLAAELQKARKERIKYEGRSKLKSQLAEEKRRTRKAKYGKAFALGKRAGTGLLKFADEITKPPKGGKKKRRNGGHSSFADFI